ncbi:hypothetical protein ACOME3_004426 [Neoechinorhynchus agilis]
MILLVQIRTLQTMVYQNFKAERCNVLPHQDYSSKKYRLWKRNFEYIIKKIVDLKDKLAHIGPDVYELIFDCTKMLQLPVGPCCSNVSLASGNIGKKTLGKVKADTRYTGTCLLQHRPRIDVNSTTRITLFDDVKKRACHRTQFRALTHPRICINVDCRM